MHLGHVGLALTTGFVAILNFLQLVHAIQKKIDLGAPGDWLSFFVRVTPATLACGGVVWAGDTLLARPSHDPLAARRGDSLRQYRRGGLVYFGLTTLLRVPESVEMAALIKRKLGRSGSAR